MELDYAGEDSTVDRSVGLAHVIVINLVKDLAGKGYNIYGDNFYSSPTLFLQIYTMGFRACETAGTAHFQKGKLKKGEMMTYRDGPLMGLKWMDKRQVVVLSTIYDDSMVEKRRRIRMVVGGVEIIRQPKGISEYNEYMGRVDKVTN